MNVTLQIAAPIRSVLAGSRLARLYTWIRRTRAAARARRALTGMDTRALRDIGLTHRDIAVLNVVR